MKETLNIKPKYDNNKCTGKPVPVGNPMNVNSSGSVDGEMQ